jgi:asparagine synthetase B (glutamine-hydrolysing)
MCGIAGWISYDRDLTAHQDIIAAMMKKMLRRGPDAGGIWIESNSASKPVFVSPSRDHRAQRRSRTGVGSHSI